MTRPVTEKVEWVGLNDDKTEYFENIWPLNDGVSYNSYLIRDEKTVLVDTAPSGMEEDYLNNLKSVIDPSEIDYLVINHMEPDHSGLIPELKERFGVTVICTEKGKDLLESLYGITEDVRTVDGDSELDIGEETISFIETPFVHWPETMMTYLEKQKIVFSGDAFGTFGSLSDKIFDDELDLEHYVTEGRRYFSNVIGTYTSATKAAISKVKSLDIDILAPSHGPIWRQEPEKIIDLYDGWCNMEGKGVLIIYGSMYGNTESLVDAIKEGLKQSGVEDIKTIDASYTHVSDMLSEAWGRKSVIIGSPTYDSGVFPPVDNFLNIIERKKLKNKIGGIFGSKGWSGGATNDLRDVMEELDWEIIEPVVEFGGVPKERDLEKGKNLGKKIAERMEK